MTDARWTVSDHDTYAVLHRADGTAAARFHVIAEAHAAARAMNAAMPSHPQLRCLRQTPTGLQAATDRQIAIMRAVQHTLADVAQEHGDGK